MCYKCISDMSMGHSGIVFRVLCPKISTGQEKLAPTVLHGRRVFATLTIGAPFGANKLRTIPPQFKMDEIILNLSLCPVFAKSSRGVQDIYQRHRCLAATQVLIRISFSSDILKIFIELPSLNIHETPPPNI